MILYQISYNIFLIILGFFGIIYDRKSVIIILMCIELILLSINLFFVLTSTIHDDIYGQIFALFILTAAAAEAAIGLAILIVFFRIRQEISLNPPFLLRL
jgi:NADH-quinone oxidoreductase subunit K|tara:strand:- start:213 stop:512 length:300 start_codon:yes stop_codon:yes gene_type:complete